MKNISAIGVRALFLIILITIPYGLTHSSEVTPDFRVVIGEWVRPDGGYTIKVKNCNSDGSVDAGYYNPKSINVSASNVSVFKGLVRLFIELQAEGYPGSTYTLYYYKEKDALAGIYYQAEIGQKFEVVFLRKGE